MQTNTLWAYEVENNDHVVIDGEVIGYVYMVNDDPDSDGYLFDVVDDDGDHTELPFGPFEAVTVVSSFEDETEEVYSE